jgi:hypothetical protein
MCRSGIGQREEKDRGGKNCCLHVITFVAVGCDVPDVDVRPAVYFAASPAVKWERIAQPFLCVTQGAVGPGKAGFIRNSRFVEWSCRDGLCTRHPEIHDTAAQGDDGGWK